MEPLPQKADTLASEFAQIKALLLSLQPSGQLSACTGASEPPREGLSHHWDDGNGLASLTNVLGQHDTDLPYKREPEETGRPGGELKERV